MVLATRNEEKNIRGCLKSVSAIASEVVVVDESSTDKTREIAKKMGARVYKTKHHPIFHISKQMALAHATSGWILQLDADERVTKELEKEIKSVLEMASKDLKKRKVGNRRKKKLFERHQRIVEERDGKIGNNTGEVVAFFIPRKNIFLGKPLIHGGVYPDGVIRLVKKGKARFPQKSVHEQIQIDGEVAWLESSIEHRDSPTFERYISRLNRYTDLHAKDLKRAKVSRNIITLLNYTTLIPLVVFLKLYIRHLGFLDGMRGFVWSLFSSLHFPIAYFKYWQKGIIKK